MLGGLGSKLKNKAVQTALKAQLKKMPPEQRQMFELILEKDPELLIKMAEETQALIKEGKDQMVAMMEVGKKYQSQLQALLMNK